MPEVTPARDIGRRGPALHTHRPKTLMNVFPCARWRLTLAAAACALLAGCAAPPTNEPTLYQRLGGPAGVARLVDRLVERSASDPRTRRSFDGIKLPALKDSIAQQICHVAGGGCRYEGATMAEAHKDARIPASEFDAMVAILREELDAAGADAAAKNGLLKLLAPMKRDIVVAARADAAPPTASGAAR